MNLASNTTLRKPRLLYIDDEKENLVGFKYMFRNYYDLSLAQSGAEALELLLDGHTFDVIISDQRMPDMTGVDFFEKILHDHPYTARIILTGYSDFDAIVDAVNKGKIYYYFKKPWNETEVKIVVDNAIEAHRLEVQLEENEKRFRDVVQSMGDWMWETNTDWQYTFAAGDVKSIWGCEAQEMLGKTPFDFVSTEDMERIKNTLTDYSKSQKIIKDLELFIDGTDGKRICLRVNAVPVYQENDFIGYRGVDRNITEHKQMQEQLNQAEKMQVIGQLAGGVAHDFNNQLAGILGFAEVLQGYLKDEELIYYAESIIKASERAADLTAQLLAFSRMGKTLTSEVNINHIIDEVVSILEHTIDKKIQIYRELNAVDPITTGDPSQLQNVFLNLGINARDAMPAGGIIIFKTDIVELGEAFCDSNTYNISPGKYINISIKDNGCGMSRKIIRRIFEPFYTTKPEGKGTGMGLAGSDGTIRSHDGAIHVKSTPGEGSEFNVYLPLMDQVHQQNQIVKENLQTGNAHILLVDDEDIVRNVGEALLRRLGYTVTPFSSGTEAINFYKHNYSSVDLVILDMIMPIKSGSDVFRTMKGINPDIKAVLASGYSLNHDVQKLLDQGVYAFLGKPYRLAELSNELARILDK